MKTIEEIALIFFGIGCSLEGRYSFEFAYPNIVTGCHKIDPASVRKLNETPQFDAFVAPDTGIGGGAFEVAGKKVVDDTRAKNLSGVDHFMRDLQCLRDIPGNADFTAPTLFPSLGGCDRFVFVFPDLKRDSVNVVALANQKRCGDGTVHSSAHAKENCRASHKDAILPGRQEKG